MCLFGKPGTTSPGHALAITGEPRDLKMPSLLRFLIAVAVIGGVIYGGIFALANFVNPKPRDMTINVPPDKFLKK